MSLKRPVQQQPLQQQPLQQLPVGTAARMQEVILAIPVMLVTPVMLVMLAMLVMLPLEARRPILLALLSLEAMPLPNRAVMQVDKTVVMEVLRTEALPLLALVRTPLLLPPHRHRMEARLPAVRMLAPMVKDLDVDVEAEEAAVTSSHKFAVDKLEIGEIAPLLGCDPQSHLG